MQYCCNTDTLSHSVIGLQGHMNSQLVREQVENEKNPSSFTPPNDKKRLFTCVDASGEEDQEEPEGVDQGR